MFEVRIDVPAGSWIVGESVRLDVPTAQPKQVLAVPRDAIVLEAPLYDAENLLPRTDSEQLRAQA